MIFISKNAEPQELRDWKLQQERADIFPRYFDLRGTPRNAVQKSLLHEQGFICAYCQCRIADEQKLRIEHWKAQSSDKSSFEHEVDYSNFLGVCRGVEGIYERFCERNREDKPLSINPTDRRSMNTISYSKDGLIMSNDSHMNNDLNQTLNLNLQTLKINRKKAWEGVETALNVRNKRNPNKDKEWRKQDVQKQLTKYTTKNSDGHLIPYCGIVIFFLEKKLGKLS